MAKKKTTKKEKAKVEEPVVEVVAEEPVVEVVAEEPVVEVVAEAEHDFKNTSGGKFELFGVYWEVDEVKPFPKKLKTEQKFKYAIKLGCLTEV